MKISIIIPTVYGNEEREVFFGRCMSTLYKQRPYQIIVGQDLERSASKIRNKLIKKADGDIIGTIDDHIELVDGTLEKVERIFNNYGIDFLQGVFKGGHHTDKRYFGLAGAMFWRKEISNLIKFDENIQSTGHEDLLLGRDLLTQGVRCGISESVVGVHYGKTTTIYNEEKDNYARNKYPERRDFLKKENLSYYEGEVLVIN